ncbi:putative nucleic acid-binding Zn ribbon protein [Mucilaginibacter sp. SG538B]|uniref:hypothetical protein n=1 Tax=Mucilaginibacter sp. SG538B TaxID=2587021 RepID=UPI00159D1A91|nr:hypothetical protein [Mucilaginibacter sp. SG538B]NVM66694.1 putative nucleic acid-binding Zn ribbon protein [Mucilaginibacter sp. SG538B]
MTLDAPHSINEKTCLECGQPLGAGRDDRKFCNDICRTAYNNRRRKGNQKEPEADHRDSPNFRKIYEILLSNRELLMMHSLYKDEPYMLRDLLGKGLNLKYFTSQYEMPEVGTFNFCFDYGYHITSTGRVYIEENVQEIFC